jgi:hypothetical protein
MKLLGNFILEFLSPMFAVFVFALHAGTMIAYGVFIYTNW